MNLDTRSRKPVALGAWGASRADLQLRGDSDKEGPSYVDRRASPGVEVARSECGRREQREQPFSEIWGGGQELSVGEALDAGRDVQRAATGLERCIPPNEVGPATRAILGRRLDPEHGLRGRGARFGRAAH